MTPEKRKELDVEIISWWNSTAKRLDAIFPQPEAVLAWLDRNGWLRDEPEKKEKP